MKKSRSGMLRRRKKLNIQAQGHIENNELICFGVAEHKLKEELPEVSQRLQKDLDFVSALLSLSSVSLLSMTSPGAL